jgi:hypothetical protein
MLAAATVVLFAYNAAISVPVASEISRGGGSGGATIIAYRTLLVSPDAVSINLVHVSGETRPVDIFRALLRAASSLKGRHFNKVVLMHGLKRMFVLDGTAFQEMGEAYSGGGSIQLITSLPSKLKNPDGTDAFGTWTGGWLGVLGSQLEDSNRFAVGWSTGSVPPSTRQ